MSVTPKLSRPALRMLLVFFFLPGSVYAQETTSPGDSGCRGTLVGSVPSRPSVSNAANTTQCGVVELEYGIEHQWVSEDVHHDDLSGGLRFGITPTLDFHWTSADFMSITDGTGEHSGFGDTWLGLKYRLTRQSKYVPSLGIFYSAKIPTADLALGGSGRVDHTISFLVSKDLGPVHTDFNVTPLLAGRPAAPGFDHNTGFALSSSLQLSKRLSLITEGYGYNSLNAANPAFASTMTGLTYQVNPRLVLDSGLDVGVTSYAPRERVFLGVTYAIANLYSWMRPLQ